MTSDDRWGSVSADQDAAGDGDADELAQILAMAGGADDSGSGPGGGALADALSQGVTTGPTGDDARPRTRRRRVARRAARRRGRARRALARDEDRAVPGPDPGARRGAGRPAALLPGDPRRRHQRQELGHADDRRAAHPHRSAHRALHQPPPAAGHRADRDRRRPDQRAPLRRDLPGDRALPRHRRPGAGRRSAALEVRGAHRDGVRGLRRRPGGRRRARGRARRELGRHERRRRRGRRDHPGRTSTTSPTSARTSPASPPRRPASSSRAPSR